MVKTYSEAEIVDNVVEISTYRNGVRLAHLDRLEDDLYDARTTHVSNVDGVDVRIVPQTHTLQEIDSTVDESGFPKLTVNSRHAPMTCAISRPNTQYDNRKTLVSCTPDTKEIDLEDLMTGMRGYRGLFNGLGLDAERQGLQNLYHDLNVDSSEPLHRRHRLIQLANQDVRNQNRIDYSRIYFIEDEIRSRLETKVQDRIKEEARHNVDDMPDVVYRKVNSGYLLDCLVNGGCFNSSGVNSWSNYRSDGKYPREDPRNPPQLSFSERYLDSCELFTPPERQEVTMVMRIPKTACPLRMKYADRGEDLYATDEGALYPIAVRKHIEETCPACDCIDEAYVKNHGQSASWESEDEIIITQCNSGRVNFDPDDILHLVVETQCGVDFEKVKEDISLVAPEYADRVISFEEWQEKYANDYDQTGRKSTT